MDDIKFDWKEVFEPNDYLYFYSDAVKDEVTEKQVSFIVKELNITEKKKILDIPCGFGRHSNKLGLLGHEVVGVDFIKEFLEMGENEAKNLGINVKYILKDMREIDFDNEFDIAICIFTSFGYFEDDENLKVLRNISKALKVGGLFFLDLINRDYIVKNLLPYMVLEKGEDLLIERNRFDIFTSRVYNERLIYRNGKMRRTPYYVRLYSYTEIKNMFENVSLKIIKSFGDFSGNPLSINSPRMIVIGEKINI